MFLQERWRFPLAATSTAPLVITRLAWAAVTVTTVTQSQRLFYAGGRSYLLKPHRVPINSANKVVLFHLLSVQVPPDYAISTMSTHTAPMTLVN